MVGGFQTSHWLPCTSTISRPINSYQVLKCIYLFNFGTFSATFLIPGPNMCNYMIGSLPRIWDFKLFQTGSLNDRWNTQTWMCPSCLVGGQRHCAVPHFFCPSAATETKLARQCWRLKGGILFIKCRTDKVLLFVYKIPKVEPLKTSFCKKRRKIPEM